MTLKHSGKRAKTAEVATNSATYYKLLIIITAVVIAILHRNHINSMFENDRHFSHLSTLERELTFRTEMGLYYSYFKSITEAETFVEGLKEVMYDNVTEFPLVINTLKRFNLYPEVLLGAAYRIYDQSSGWLGRRTTICYHVVRGQGLSDVQSCEGLGEKPYFYIEAVFLLNGISMAVFFLFGCFLSESYLGGLITVLCFFYNHGECTRVQWTPPLRESFSYPFLVLQMLVVSYAIRSGNKSNKLVASIALATSSFMLPWQFAQFALLMQTFSVFATYLLGFIPADTVRVVVAGQAGGLLISLVMLFGNEMLITSFFSSALIASWVLLWLEKPLLEKKVPKIVISVIQGVCLIVLTFYIKVLASKLLGIADDEHIGDIFRSKFSSFKNFHTMLYLCAPEFDFIEIATPVRLTKTLLIPTAIVTSSLIVLKVLLPQVKILFSRQQTPLETTQTTPHTTTKESNGVHKNGKATQINNTSPKPDMENKEGCELVYNLLQGISFTLMAIIIMRLKLFWTPHLCILSSLIASKKLCPASLKTGNVQTTVIVALVAAMSVGGLSNLKHQWSIQGEFSNAQMEGLIDWINNSTDPKAVFGGPMPTMATVKLCTKRPIVNHPHYEDTGLRNRTVKVYSMFSRHPLSKVHETYKELQLDYFIVEEHWCRGRPKPGCGMTDLWDMEDKENLGNDPVCQVLSRDEGSQFFKQVYKNQQYHVYKVL